MENFQQSVCLNGHQISIRNEGSSQYCPECGASVISLCPECNHPIPGDYKIDGILDLTKHKIPVPNYCEDCGQPFPWTKSAIESSNELIDLSNLAQDEKDSFKSSIPDLLVETPKTSSAIAKFKLYSKKAGPFVADGLRSIIVDIASDVIVKELGF